MSTADNIGTMSVMQLVIKSEIHKDNLVYNMETCHMIQGPNIVKSAAVNIL